MCGCSTHQPQSGTTAERDPTAVTLKVEDMTCGHCASTITKAVEAGLPAARVQADPATKLVSIQGTRDLAKVEALIVGAGYTPSVPALG
jgi:copper chaperone